MKMNWKRATISALALSLVACANAAGKVKVVFPPNTTHTVWVLPEVPTSTPGGGRNFSTSEVNLDIPDGRESGYIVALERASGNLAIKPVSEATPEWKITDEDYGISEVVIIVELDGKLLKSGIVVIESGARQSQAPIIRDEARLYHVPHGTVQVTVKYGEVGAERMSPVQTLTLPLNRTELVPVRKIAISSPAGATDSGDEDEPREQAPPAQGQRGSQESAPDEGDDSPAGGIVRTCGQFLLWLFVLAGVATVLVLLIRFLKKNQGQVSGSLQSLGIQIPDGTDTAGLPVSEPSSKEVASSAPVVPPGHCPYCGEPEASCMCRADSPQQPSQSPATPAPSIGTATRLVSESGDSISIPEGVSIVGREAGTAQMILNDPTVSRAHAEIEKSSGRLIVRDKGSSNGTFVNGTKISGDTDLRTGDTVQFGAVRMRVET